MASLTRRIILLSGIGAALGGCAAFVVPSANLPALPTTPIAPYRLGAGDEVEIRIFDQSQLSGQYAVDDSGFINMPLLGLIRAGDSSPDALGSRIGFALQAQKLILAPRVAVEISRYRPFYILGEVNTPGQFPFRPGMTVLTPLPSPVVSPIAPSKTMPVSRAIQAVGPRNIERRIPRWFNPVTSLRSSSGDSEV